MNQRATQSRVSHRGDICTDVFLLTLLLNIDFNVFAEKAKNRELINNLNNKRNTTSLLPTSMSTSTAASQVKKVNMCAQRTGSVRTEQER